MSDVRQHLHMLRKDQRRGFEDGNVEISHVPPSRIWPLHSNIELYRFSKDAKRYPYRFNQLFNKVVEKLSATELLDQVAEETEDAFEWESAHRIGTFLLLKNALQFGAIDIVEQNVGLFWIQVDRSTRRISISPDWWPDIAFDYSFSDITFYNETTAIYNDAEIGVPFHRMDFGDEIIVHVNMPQMAVLRGWLK